MLEPRKASKHTQTRTGVALDGLFPVNNGIRGILSIFRKNHIIAIDIAIWRIFPLESLMPSVGHCWSQGWA